MEPSEENVIEPLSDMMEDIENPNLEPDSIMGQASSIDDDNQLLGLDIDVREVDKLFEILFDTDTNGLTDYLNYNRQHRSSKPTRRFAPYPVHQQLYLQQQREQERRRVSFITVTQNPTLPRDCSDICKSQDPSLTQSKLFRTNIVKAIIAHIDRHSSRLMSSESDACDKCVICMYNYQSDQTIRILKCKHKFHRVCIDEWIFKSYSCPVCRADLTGSGRIFRGLAILHHIHEEQNLERLCFRDSSSTSSDDE